MREVKFRAWSEYSNKLVVWEHMKADDTLGGVLNGDDKKIHVMQYTGLKDINHRDVYEKDIVEDIAGRRYIVEYNLFYAYMLFAVEDRTSYMAMYPTIKLKIIGNFYENPDLLEAE